MRMRVEIHGEQKLRRARKKTITLSQGVGVGAIEEGGGGSYNYGE